MKADDRTVLKRGVAYPLADRLTLEEQRRAGVEGAHPQVQGQIMAVWDGSPRRQPKKGEWYLSGCSIDAYRAPNDLPSEYHIARLVKVETQTVQVITELTEKGG